MSVEKWNYDPNEDIYLTGTPHNGCGVYQEKDKWFGNVCYDDTDIFRIGPYSSFSEACIECESKLKELHG